MTATMNPTPARSLEGSESARLAHASNITLPRRPPQSSFSITSLPEAQFNSQSGRSIQLNSAYPSPLPLLPLTSAQVASLRGNLSRRRSSYPPANVQTNNLWPIGGTPNAKSSEVFDVLPSFGSELSSEAMAGANIWEGLLDFDTTPERSPVKLDASVLGRDQDQPSKPSTAQSMARAKSEPGEAKAGPSKAALHMTPGRIAQAATDLAWKTILGSVIEIESVGEVGVCRVLQEVWKRGGGDTVTNQGLWSSIIMALSLPSTATTSVRISAPSPQAAQSLQQLYNLTLRQWEPAIFSGLLANYTASFTPTALAPRDIEFPSVSAPKYGASTPIKEFDQSFVQWTNTTPGLGGDFSVLFGGSTDLTPRGAAHPSNLGQFEFHFEEQRPSLNETSSGIDEILASMDEANEREIIQAATAESTPHDTSLARIPNKRNNSAFQLPTPETDSDNSGNTPHRKSSLHESHHIPSFSPESMASPFVTASSSTPSTASKDLMPAISSRAAAPTSLIMPTDSFVPPPPMCMFFNPSFRDLQQGKVGVWKGDLDLKGKGGGRFSVLIVGEEVSGHLWQSHTWAPTLAHPFDQNPENSTSSFTSKMIPVAYLAREGFTPVTMGMVLCNDSKIQEYVSMVQSLHAEGVAFHLPNPANLPLVFLPAKFDPNDPLQRLGIAYMTKPGAPIPGAAPAKISRPRTSDESTTASKRKRRRQSAPAKPLPGRKKDTFGGMPGDRLEEGVIEDGEAS